MEVLESRKGDLLITHFDVSLFSGHAAPPHGGHFVASQRGSNCECLYIMFRYQCTCAAFIKKMDADALSGVCDHSNLDHIMSSASDMQCRLQLTAGPPPLKLSRRNTK